mgnify:CR=1 FL=1
MQYTDQHAKLLLKALRTNTTWKTTKGVLTLSEVARLPLSILNEIAQSDYRAAQTETVSFIGDSPKTATQAAAEERLEILKLIIADRQQTDREARTRAEKQAELRRKADLLHSIIQAKNLENLQQTDLPALQAQLAELQAQLEQ